MLTPCDCPYPHRYYLADWNTITNPTVARVKEHIDMYGPIVTILHLNIDAFTSYSGGVFSDCADPPNKTHDVVVVGWDDDPDDGDEGVFVLRNSKGANWGEDGYMRMTYSCYETWETDSYYLVYDPLPTLLFEYPLGRPTMLAPGEDTNVHVYIHGEYDAVLDPQEVRLHYSLNGATGTSRPAVVPDRPLSLGPELVAVDGVVA